MNWKEDYESKFKSADEAVAVVKDGDHVAYGEFAMASPYLDAAFAKRVPALRDIILRSTTCPFPPKAVLADPCMEHLMYNDWHFSPASRKLCYRGLCRYIPMNYHQGPETIRRGLIHAIDVLMIMVSPPDQDGFVSLGTSSSIVPTYLEKAGYVIAEVNSSVPRTFCDEKSKVHVSQIDCFVQGPNLPIIEAPTPPPTEVDEKIAEMVVGLIGDRACVQLGIGAMPNAVGQLIARAVLKDPAILILDEATASVDSETESIIQEAIERIINGRTTIMIAHRLSTLKKADKIIVVEDGKISEMGSHNELMEKQGRYYRLVKIQSLARELSDEGGIFEGDGK